MNLLLTIGIIVGICSGVDRKNFKTCDQSGFCKRLRGMEKDRSGYLVDSETVSLLNASSVSFDIKHEVKSHLHRAIIRVLADNTVRITMQEKEPVYPRYSPVDSLGPALLKDGSCELLKEEQTATMKFGDNKIIVTYNPVHIEIYASDSVVASLNARGLFHIETQLLKPEVQEEPKAEEITEENELEKEGEKQEESEEDDLGLSVEDIARMDWEESFNSHDDTNPRGPRAISLDVTFPGFDKVYGLPEHADNFVLKGTKDTDPYRLYNLDVFEYELDNPMALYGAIPFIHALSPERSIGMMWLNAAETWVDIEYSSDKSLVGRVLSSLMSSDNTPRVDTHWMSESGLLDLFIFLGPTPRNVMTQYSHVFGPSYLPPLFSIAYHQCRWNYNDQRDVEEVDANFDKYDIPMDVMWLDIEHTNGKRYFTWDSKKFPDSVKMLDSLANKGRYMVTIVDPHIKVDSGYHVYSEGKDHPSCNIFVKNKNSGNFEGHCWPGGSSWVDYTSPCAREWWAEQFSYDKYQGSTANLFTWNDMNEPSVFNGPEITMPKDNIHAENWEHRDVHNIYGYYTHLATHQGQLMRSGNKERAFVLSRAFFAGSHRVGPIWTGDNLASWEHLRISVPMLLSLNIAGYPFVGADTGGFFGNPDKELLTRWYQTAVFTPFLRAHAHIDTRRREPWLFGQETTELIREALITRYQLLPYLYTLFYQASVDNTPIMRPLWYDNVKDTSLYDNQREFMLGDSLLISPVLESGAHSHTVTLPGGTDQVWYNYFTFKKYSAGSVSLSVSMSTMPVYIKGGSIIPIKKRLRRSSALMADDPYTLYVAVNTQGHASGDIYVDDGKTFDFQENKFTFKHLLFNGKTLSCRSNPSDGLYLTPAVERIVVIGLQTAPNSVSVKGIKLTTTYDKSFQTLTIKKPGIKISDEWDIEFN